MTELPKNPTREELKGHYEASGEAPTECWENYGDVNPAPHGGDWIHYDGSWTFIGTFVAEQIGYPTEDLDVDDPIRAQVVYYEEVRWSDLVTEDGEWTDAARGTVQSLHSGPQTPATAIVNGVMTSFVVAYAAESRTLYNHRDPVYCGEYREILESVGVEPCENDL